MCCLRPRPRARAPAVIHDVLLLAPAGAATEPPTLRGLEAAFRAVWTGLAENDVLNSLVLTSAMTWPEVALLRAFGRYIRQSAASYSNDYMAQTLVKHSSDRATHRAAFLRAV